MKTLASLESNAQQLLTESVAWMDRFWDEATGLLWNPGDAPDPHIFEPTGGHMVRESVWYALGLLIRNRAGDTARAIRILDVALTCQFDAPGQPYHGTFFRAPEEPYPPAEPQEWRHYDPNWREFIVTTLAIILQEYEDRLPRALLCRINLAIRKAVEGALVRRLQASYTNIALMNAYLLCFAGRRLGDPGWIDQGEQMAREIYRLFKQHDTFEEYNSPTYYGVDLYALALWRVYPMSSLLQQLGAEMEALFWTDIARFYHAGLRNLCGPFDRSYGMDMRHYVALTGEWVWLITGKDQSPFPETDRRFAHAADFCFGPLVAILGTQVPAAARSHFLSFQGERWVERVISDSPRRVATAWLSDDVMIGAEQTSGSRRGTLQFHPGTIHWRVGPDSVGWVRLCHDEPVDACAQPGRLEITGTGELIFLVSAPGPALSAVEGVQPDAIRPDRWWLPGLSVQVETTALMTHVEYYSNAGQVSQPAVVEIHYTAGGGQAITLALQINRKGLIE